MAVHWGGRGPGHVSRGGGLFASLRLDFLNNVSAIDPRITFTRASSATRVNSSGLIETVSSNVARFDYDPVTLAAKGLLIEEQRTNLAAFSDDAFSVWVVGASVTITNAYLNPLTGTNNAALLSGASSTTWGSVNAVNRAFSGLSSSTAYTGSLWFVPVTATSITLALRDSSTGAYATTTQACTPGVPVRLATTITTGAATTGLALMPAGNGDFITYGRQLEVGSFATSYIPAPGASTVTRAADVASITGTNFSDWFNQAAGTFVFTGSSPASGTRVLWQADDGTADNRYTLYTTGTSLKFDVVTGGVTQASLTLGTIVANTQFKAAVAFAANDIAAVLNGGTVQTDASATLPTVDRLRIGADTTGNYQCGHHARDTAYPVRLSNAQIQNLAA